MAQATMPEAVKLICGMISARRELFSWADEALVGRFGPIDLAGEVMDFDFTHYYDSQMGTPLFRRFVSFERLVQPDALAGAKLATNEFEARAAGLFGCVARPVNLDPGYITPAKLVLASMKDFSHRIYLAQGVYAEVTLLYVRGRWQSHPWTFPDYASGRYDGFFNNARSLIASAGREKRK